MATIAPQAQGMDRFGDADAFIITQEFAAIELCGIEAKNRYRAYQAGADESITSTSGLPNTMYINEESKTFERICCGPNRSLTLIVHKGDSKEGPEMLRFHKPFHLQGCICCRPSMTISDSAGKQLGRVEDPFVCCAMNQKVFDDQDKLKYNVEGSICQIGLCCPCCGDVKFDVTDAQGGSPGVIKKLFGGCSELCLGTNKFKVTFPKNATEPDKSLLLGATMLVDLQYFEAKEKKQG